VLSPTASATSASSATAAAMCLWLHAGVQTLSQSIVPPLLNAITTNSLQQRADAALLPSTHLLEHTRLMINVRREGMGLLSRHSGVELDDRGRHEATRQSPNLRVLQG
jgi:hypothetical protein